jgi:ribosome-binding protein aMBF1 (putative translation factor)
MPKKISFIKLTDVELAESYLRVKAEEHRLREEIRETESAFGTKPSSEWLARVKEVRAAQHRVPYSWLFHSEIVRRLNEPLMTARRARGLTQGELVERTGVSRKFIQLIEAGRAVANYRTAIRLWRALDLEVPQGWDSLDQ